EMESTSFSDFAVEPHPAVHHVDQIDGDGEAEPCSTKASRHRTIGLAECFENGLPSILGDSEASVANGHVQFNRLRLDGDRFDRDVYFPLLCKLNRVTDEVHDDLTKTVGISGKTIRNIWRNPAIQLQSLFCRARRERSQSVAQGVAEKEWNVFQL